LAYFGLQCSSIWSHKNFTQSTKIQNRATRYYLGVHKNAPDLAVQGEMGWILPEYKYYISCLRYWNRLIKMNPDRLTRKVFEWDFQLLNSNSWCYKIESIFEKIGLWDFFSNGKEIDLKVAKDLLIDDMNQTWAEKLPYKPKLRLYSIVKTCIETENFVTAFIPKYQRSLMAQIRIGILPLAIETGRYTRTDLDNRLCLLCDNGHIEDETHFLCQCPAYRNIRDKYIQTLSMCIENLPTMDILDQFLSILTFPNQKLIAKFVYEMWLFRKQKLFV